MEKWSGTLTEYPIAFIVNEYLSTDLFLGAPSKYKSNINTYSTYKDNNCCSLLLWNSFLLPLNYLIDEQLIGISFS